MSTQHNVFIRKFGKLAIVMTVTDWDDFKELETVSEKDDPDFLLTGITAKSIYSNMNPSILISTSGEVRDITEGTKGAGLANIILGNSNAGPIWGYRHIDGLMAIDEMITPKLNTKEEQK